MDTAHVYTVKCSMYSKMVGVIPMIIDGLKKKLLGFRFSSEFCNLRSRIGKSFVNMESCKTGPC